MSCKIGPQRTTELKENHRDKRHQKGLNIYLCGPPFPPRLSVAFPFYCEIFFFQFIHRMRNGRNCMLLIDFFVSPLSKFTNFVDFLPHLRRGKNIFENEFYRPFAPMGQDESIKNLIIHFSLRVVSNRHLQLSFDY